MPVPGTAHFQPAEVLRASAPATEADVSARALAVGRTLEALEAVRAILGRPLVLTSLVRTEAENASEGGSPTSGHLDGSAADFTVSGMTTDQAMRLIAPHVRRLSLDQVIIYRGHVHVGTGPKRRSQLLDKRSGVLLPWTPDATLLAPILPDATRAPRMQTTLTNPATPPSSNRAFIIGALIAALGGILAWLQKGGN